ncbi:MAG: hypothetical protein ACM3NE_06500 [Hyphomicrobiales bacterium]
MREHAKEPFRWLPGRGWDPAALCRLRQRFPRPVEPLNEAWFLAGAPRDEVDDGWMSYWEVRDALYDLASDPTQPGARDWFHFLLAQEIPGAILGSVMPPLVEALATGLFVFHPLGADREPYEGFIRDCRDTLGAAIMGRDGWSSRGEINRGAILRRRWGLGAGWEWGRPAGDLSASMFVCLKYLPQDEIGPWLRSVFQIRDPVWRGQLMAWFVGARHILDGTIDQPADLPVKGQPAISWTDCNFVTGPAPFLSPANRRAALDAVAAIFTDCAFTEWARDVLSDEELAADLGRLPWRFQELFVRVPA